MEKQSKKTTKIADKQSKNTNSSTKKSKSNLPIVIMILLAGASAGYLGGYYGVKHDESSSRNVTENRQIINSESELISQIAEDVGKSVVSVNVKSESTRQTFFSGPQSFTRESAGTGVIISEDGVVITNRHVIPQNTSSVSVTLSDGTTLDDVEVIGKTNQSDPLDIAFLKINDFKDKDIVPAKIGDSAESKVGDKVIAIGNALGQFQNTVTSGIISGYGRSVQASDAQKVETLQNLFQTDASINQGNSGGPLVNINGEVIGINTAVAGNGAENIGFAIPVNDIKGLITSVLDKGELLRPYLGIRYVTLNDDYAYEYNLDVNRGAYIAPNRQQDPILKDSPADKAGLKEKDIITKVDDSQIDETNSLISLLGQHAVGDKVNLTVLRDGQEQIIEVTLEAAPKD